MNLVKYKNFFFGLSLLFVIPGVAALSIWGLRLGVDFVGGALWEIKFVQSEQEAGSVDAGKFESFLNEKGAEVSSVAATSGNSILIKMRIADEAKIAEIKKEINISFGEIEDLRLETVGPVISKELTKKALMAVVIAVVAIVLYVTWSFRAVPKPASPVAFGFCTIFALIHDILIVVGIFVFLGHFFNIEVDSLFITALLTVIGFSVHDTIVVFDRIRENLRKHSDFSFEKVVNHSLLETMARSLNTSVTVVFVLLALILFGGETIKIFVLALLVGIISGTYSSIFTAAPLLVVWNDIGRRRRRI